MKVQGKNQMLHVVKVTTDIEQLQNQRENVAVIVSIGGHVVPLPRSLKTSVYGSVWGLSGLRAAFSAMPETPRRASSAAQTSAGRTPRAAHKTSR